MSETNNIIISIIIFLCWSVGCFFAGILYYTRTNNNSATINRQYETKQQEYELVIATTTKQIADIRNDLQREVYISTRTVEGIDDLLAEIRKQKLNL